MNCRSAGGSPGRATARPTCTTSKFIDGRCSVSAAQGAAPPKLTITVDGAEFLRLATGNSDPVKAYFTGGSRSPAT